MKSAFLLDTGFSDNIEFNSASHDTIEDSSKRSNRKPNSSISYLKGITVRARSKSAVARAAMNAFDGIRSRDLEQKSAITPPLSNAAKTIIRQRMIVANTFT